MDPFHLPAGPSRPPVDRQGRQPVPFPPDWDARLPPHRGGRPLLAFSFRLRFRPHRGLFRADAVLHRPVAALGAPVTAGFPPSLGHVGALRDLPYPARAQWLLRLQCLAADRVLYGGLRLRAAGDPDRHRDVAGRGQPLRMVRADLRRPAVGPFAALPRDPRLPRVYRRARDPRGDDRIRAEHESYRAGYRQREACRGISRLRGRGGGGALLGGRPLRLLEPSARAPACAEIRHLSADAAHVQSASAVGPLHPARYLALLLAERKDTGPGGLEA